MAADLRQLRYFVAVAEELNFTRAAARLYVTQPSLSSAIRQLELSISAQLFERDTRRVSLTAAGDALLPRAIEAIEAAEAGIRAAQRAARESAGDAAPVYRLLYTIPLEPVALAGLDRLESLGRGPATTALGVWSGEVISDLSEGRADGALMRFPDDRSDLRTHEFRGDRVCALVSEAHPLAAGEQIPIATLARYPTLRWGDGLGFNQYNAFVASVFTDAGCEQRPFYVDRVDVPGWLPVVRNQACALIGSSERAPGGVRKVSLQDAPRMPIMLCCRDDAAIPEPLTDAIQSVIETLSLF